MRSAASFGAKDPGAGNDSVVFARFWIIHYTLWLREGQELSIRGKCPESRIYVLEKSDRSRVIKSIEGSAKAHWRRSNLIANGRQPLLAERGEKKETRFIRHERYWRRSETALGKDIRSQGAARRKEKLRQPANDESSPGGLVSRALAPFLLISSEHPRTLSTRRLLRERDTYHEPSPSLPC